MSLNEPNQQTTTTNRVEPTFSGGDDEVNQVADQGAHQAMHQQRTEPQQHTSETTQSTQYIAANLSLAKNWLLAQKRTHLIGGGFAVFISIIAISLLSSGDEELPTPIVEQIVQVPEKIRDHVLEMPHNYWLMQDENQGIIIHWPSYEDNNDELWSILTAKGEQSCQTLSFDAATQFRTNVVTIEQDGDYYANFSPLDSKALINALADKSNFSVCGYEFSLKGSRAALSRSEIFSAYL